MISLRHYSEFCKIQADVDGYQKKFFSVSEEMKYDVLKECYAYLKEASKDVVDSPVEAEMMAVITSQIYAFSQMLPPDSLIKPKPYDFNKEVKLKYGMDAEGILDFLVYQERCRLFNSAKSFGIRSFEDYDPIDDCRESALSVYNMAKRMGINAVVKMIEPGYLYDSPLCKGGCKHCVVVLQLLGIPYLIDATYLQFFMRKRCMLEALGAVYMPLPNPGTYMVMDEGRRKTAEKVLNDGWMMMTNENVKNYLDGFTMYYRNGLYYENTGDFSYMPEYDARTYFNFLDHRDSQARYEDYEGLGYQYRALKNPKMDFSRR